MSSLIKSSALLIAIVGLAVASNASLVNGESRDNIPGSLSELGDFDSLDWVKVLRSECKANNCEPDKVFELLRKLDKIYAALDKDAKTNRNEQKMAEQFEINQIDGDEFCTGENFRQLAELSYCYHRQCLKTHDPSITAYRESVGEYLIERVDKFAFVCRSYELKSLNKRVGDLNELYRHDMEETLGNKLVWLKESHKKMVKHRSNMFSTDSTTNKKISSKWVAVLLEFLKEKSGNNLDAKCYITTGDEGRKEFEKLYKDSVVDMCRGWMDATRETIKFRQRDKRQEEDYTEEQASWMKYADVCDEMRPLRELIVESLYSKLKSELSMFPSLKLAMNRKFKKMSNAGVKSQ